MKNRLSCHFSFFLLFLILPFTEKTAAQTSFTKLSLEVLETSYEKYKEAELTHRRFKHDDLQPLIQKHKKSFKIEELGKSVEGRSISGFDWGEGPTKVMLWSQMHGNESTATMALFDLLNFLEATGDEFEPLRKELRAKLSVKIIPMLNPDGAEVFKRRNALDIDLNRDAISLISPEAAILKSTRDSFEPKFGFNLHDQQIYYNVLNTPKQATVSVLAPAYNEATEVNEVRGRAMQVIVGMNDLLQRLIPGQVGKYDDAYEPRAFGDNIQKWGTSTILIESGGYRDDPEKQYIRKLNFFMILNALHQIATEGYLAYSVEQYFDIPDNGFQLMDLILNEVNVKVVGKHYPMDLAIKRRESSADSTYYTTGMIEDLGDMQVYFGLDELDASGLELIPGKVYGEAFEHWNEINFSKAMDLLKQGYLAVKVRQAEPNELHNLPILVLKNAESFSYGWTIGSSPNFFLSKGGSLKYAVVNGYLIDLEKPLEQVIKQRIL